VTLEQDLYTRNKNIRLIADSVSAYTRHPEVNPETNEVYFTGKAAPLGVGDITCSSLVLHKLPYQADPVVPGLYGTTQCEHSYGVTASTQDAQFTSALLYALGYPNASVIASSTAHVVWRSAAASLMAVQVASCTQAVQVASCTSAAHSLRWRLP
jgi:hypothetical protein